MMLLWCVQRFAARLIEGLELELITTLVHNNYCVCRLQSCMVLWSIMSA